jgi:hypothetical protein
MARGQMMVVFAVALPILVGALALCADIGVFYYNWVLLQKAADAAALAGASYLPSQTAKAVAAANNYANLNTVLNGEIVSNQVAAGNQSITVKFKRTVPYYFGRVLGLTSAPVAASATAGVQCVNSDTGGALPIGIQYNTSYTFGTQIQILTGKYTNKNGWTVGSGAWGALALGGSGLDTYKANLWGYPGTVSVGDQLSLKTGNDVIKPTVDNFNTRIAQQSTVDPGATYQNYSLNDPRIVEIPMVNWSGVNGNSSTVPVMGFAVVWIQSVDSQGNITVVFLNEVTAGASPGPNAPCYGAMVPVLLQ